MTTTEKSSKIRQEQVAKNYRVHICVEAVEWSFWTDVYAENEVAAAARGVKHLDGQARVVKVERL